MQIFPFSRSALVFLVQASSACADEAMDSFVKRLKAAIETKDVAAMEALHHKQGRSEMELKRLREGIESGFKYTPPGGPKSIEAVPLSDDFSFDAQIYNGERIEPSIAPIGLIRVEYDTMKSFKPYASVAGKPMLVAMKITKLDWKGPPDRPFWINISNSSKKPVNAWIEGSYNASGVEMPLKQKHRFVMDEGTTASGSWGSGINAQHIVSLKVTTDCADGELKVIIKEGEKPGAMPDKLVVEQAISATKPLVYQAKKP